MSIRIATLAAGALAALGACAGDPAGVVPSGGLPPVQLSIATDLSQPRETCGEIAVIATLTRVNRPVRGIVVNFVPLSGSVFAAAVATNKDGAATTYWNLGRGLEPNARLIARAVDEDGRRVLDDTLTVDRRQKPTRFVDIEAYFAVPDPNAAEYRYVLFGRVRLLDGCGDPIPGALVTIEYSGPVAPITPVSETFPTFPVTFPDQDRWGEGYAGFRFSKDATMRAGRYEILWRSAEVPSVTLTQYALFY